MTQQEYKHLSRMRRVVDSARRADALRFHHAAQYLWAKMTGRPTLQAELQLSRLKRWRG